MRFRTLLVAFGAAILVAYLVLRYYHDDKESQRREDTVEPRTGSRLNQSVRVGKQVRTEHVDASIISTILAQPSVSPRSVTVLVVDAGRRVADATVHVATVAKIESKQTDVSGQADFEMLPAMRSLVSARVDDGRWDAQEILLQEVPANREVVLDLSRCRYAIDGQISDAGGGAIAGAQVAAEMTQSIWLTIAESGTDGSFSACAPKQHLALRSSAAGYGPVITFWTWSAADLCKIAMRPEVQVSGRVFVAGGEGVANALVTFRGSPSQGNADVTTWTNAQGEFAAILATGRYRVMAVGRRAIGPAGSRYDFVFDATPESAATPILIEATRRRELDVLVVDASGNPVANKTVHASAGDGQSSIASSTQEDGRAVLFGVPLGEVKLHVSGADVAAGAIVEAGATSAELHLARGWRIQVSLSDSQGRSAVVTAIRGSGEEIKGEMVSANSYVLKGRREGEWTIRAQTPNGERAMRRIRLAPGAEELVALQLRKPVPISGRVVDTNGRGIGGAIVELSDGEEHYEAFTDEHGTFETEVLRDQEFTASVRMPFGVRVAADGEAGWPMVTSTGENLLKTSLMCWDLDGMVIESGGPLPYAQVTAIAEDRLQPPMRAHTGESGKFLLKGLCAQEIRLEAVAQDGRKLTKTIPADSRVTRQEVIMEF